MYKKCAKWQCKTCILHCKTRILWNAGLLLYYHYIVKNALLKLNKLQEILTYKFIKKGLFKSGYLCYSIVQIKQRKGIVAMKRNPESCWLM